MTQKPKILIICLLFCSSLFAGVPDTSKYVSLDPYYFHLQYLKEDSVVLIDVRQTFEYRVNRLNDAVNMPSSKNLRELADSISANYALFLYCTDDFRSTRACEICYDLGFRKIYNLEGGLVAWRKEGFPVERKRIRRRDR
jgi:rhodanese-related sulfurtransferase